MIKSKWYNLEIRDHNLMSDYGLLHWFRFISGERRLWKKILPQLIAQGFRFEVFVERCISELDNQPPLKSYLNYSYYPDFPFYHATTQFLSSPAAREIVQIIKKQMETCKNWDQFYDEMKAKSKFNRYMKCKFRNALPQASRRSRLFAKIEFLTTWNIRWTSPNTSN